MPRVEIKKSDISRLAELAQVCPRTVRHYREGWPLIRAVEAAITRAVAELPKDAQMDFGAGRQPHKCLSGDSPNMGQPGGTRSCPVGLDDSTSSTPTAPAGRSATFSLRGIVDIGQAIVAW